MGARPQKSSQAGTAKAASPPAAPGVKTRRFKLGLAGRVAAIGCCAAVAATAAQWLITPIMARPEVNRQRQVAVHAATTVVARIIARDAQDGRIDDPQFAVDLSPDGMPKAQAILFAPDGRVLAVGGANVPLPGPDDLRLLTQNREMYMQRGPRVYANQPVRVNGKTVAYAAYSFAPRTIAQIWGPIVVLNSLVLLLSLGVMAPFLLPLARAALSPVTALEARIRKRSVTEAAKLASETDDALLTPLLAAIDEIHARSDASMRRALRMAYADPVTRLPNRLRFLSKLEALVERSPGAEVHFILADLDEFRKINTTFGPTTADTVLVQVAERLRQIASQAKGEPIFLGRIGPDQFGIIAPKADQAAARAIMQAVDEAITRPMLVEGHPLRLSVSFGAAAAPFDAGTASDLLKLADLALKSAKQGTSRRHVFFDKSLLVRAREQAQLEAEIRRGLDNGEFIAVFQPKMELETGELIGAEALARWRRPDGRVVSPGVFVPIAEDIGLISKLGVAVLRDACFAAARWNRDAAHPVRIAVNVSPHQFSESSFVDTVRTALDDSKLDPKLLELEITESAAVTDPERVARIMWPLRSQGVRLAIDDFGTGHSNFSSITRLPFDVFKIDQQFIRALTTDANAPAIVEMILAMAEALGLETVAEGVETREQADFLVRRACTIGQGYYFSPPLPADEFDAFLRTWRPRPAMRYAA